MKYSKNTLAILIICQILYSLGAVHSIMLYTIWRIKIGSTDDFTNKIILFRVIAILVLSGCNRWAFTFAKSDKYKRMWEKIFFIIFIDLLLYVHVFHFFPLLIFPNYDVISVMP
jgi:hypothetical protein